MTLQNLEDINHATTEEGLGCDRTDLMHRRGFLYLGAMMPFYRYKITSGPSKAFVPAADQAPHLVKLADKQGFTKGPFTAFMVPYNRGTLRPGKDYTESFTLDPAEFPAGSVISWDWPAAHEKAQVRGFLAIDYGDYYNTVPEAPIRSSRVKDIKALQCNVDLSASGTGSGFNIIINFFLTSTLDSNSILYEIEVFLHTPDYAKFYIDSAPSLGTFTSRSGRVWKVCKDPFAVHGPDILFYPVDQADMLVGTVDLKEMLSWIKGRKVITGNEFFNGLAVGIEPQQRNGTVVVNALAVNYVV